MRRRRPPSAPRKLPDGMCYWPGSVAEGLDPVVGEQMVRAQSARNMGRLNPAMPNWRDDPTYNLKRKRKTT
jgi:hypothetical protein